MSLRSKRDPMSYPLDSGQFAQLEEIDPSTLRIAVTADLGGVPVSRDIRETFGKRVQALEPLVGTCDWIDPRLGEAMDVFWKLRSIYFIANYSHEIDSWDRDFNPNILSNYAAALKMDLKSVAEAHRMQMALYQHVQDVLERYDAIVCPGVSISPFPWVDLFPKSIEGLPSENYVGWVGMTSALTVVGNPITTIPCGVDSVGMPFGLQVVGQNFEDRRTLGIAHALERAFAGLDELKRPNPDFEKLLTPLQSFA
jgi:Asp-tRNA(Asn)/Glu-tRNA(Gln) amidotransferase A subunit family amidase